MTVSERIPFSGLLLPLQKGYTYSCDRRTTDGMELLFIFREDGHSRYYFESDMQEFDRKAASDSHTFDRVSPAGRRRRGVPAPSEARRYGQIFPFPYDQARRHADRRDVPVGGRNAHRHRFADAV